MIKLFKLLTVTLILCCLVASVFGGKLSNIDVKDNNPDLTKSHKHDVKATEVAASAKGMQNKSSVRDNDEADEADEKDDDTADDESETADDESETAENNAVQPAADTSLSIWGIVSGLWNWIKEDISGNLFGDDAGETPAIGEGRTFGKIRRLQMALIPIVFKFGVLSAMIAFLVAVSVKTLFLVKVLVVMNLLAILAKFFSFKSNYGHVEHFSAPPAPVWPPYISSGWHSTPDEHHFNKQIHLHIHGGHLQPQAPSYPYGSGTTGPTHGWEKRSDPYSAYDNIAQQNMGQQNELIANELPHAVNGNAVVNNGQQYGRSFPENHRMF